MSHQRQLAEQFAALHIKGDPLMLYNCWDAGSAQVLAQAGAAAVATGSWSVGMSHGCGDAQATPLADVVSNLRRIASAVDLPVTLDFEGGYAVEPDALQTNGALIIEAGAIGINFEDQVIGDEGIFSVEQQSARIAAIHHAAQQKDVPLFINARTDLFLKSEPSQHHQHLDDAIARAHAYAKAGAQGFFAPALAEEKLIQSLCDASPLPVNIMMTPKVPAPKTLAALGVARISYGGAPYAVAMEAFKAGAEQALAAKHELRG